MTPLQIQRLSIAACNPALAWLHHPIQMQHVPVERLRDYQIDVVEGIIAALRQGYRRILVRLPTGGGKTRIAAALHASALALGIPSQFIVHRKELIRQTSEDLREAGLDHAFIAAGRPMARPDDLVTLAGVHTLVRLLGEIAPPWLVIQDECHRSVATTWATVLNAYSDSIIIGLTATPERLDGRGLSEQFDIIVEGPSVEALMARGFLSPYDYYAPPQDLTEGEEPKLIGDIVEHYQRYAAGAQGIGFAQSVKHSLEIVDAFRGDGVRAAHVDGSTADAERDRLLEAFAARDIQVLLNVDLFDEGLDVPGISYCGLYRRTQSLVKHKQQIGRNMRPGYAPGMPRDTDEERLAAIAAGPKPRAIFCDHVGNWEMHGLPEDEPVWSLEGKTTRERLTAARDAMSIHQCKVCFQVTPSTVKVCPCGTAFPVQERKIQRRAGTLTKVEREQIALDKRKQAARRKAEEKLCRTEGDFIRLAIGRGYEEPEKWARMKVKVRRNYATRFRR